MPRCWPISPVARKTYSHSTVFGIVVSTACSKKNRSIHANRFSKRSFAVNAPFCRVNGRPFLLNDNVPETCTYQGRMGLGRGWFEKGMIFPKKMEFIFFLGSLKLKQFSSLRIENCRPHVDTQKNQGDVKSNIYCYLTLRCRL